MPNFFRDMPKLKYFFDKNKYKMYVGYFNRMSRFSDNGIREKYYGAIKNAGIAYIIVRFIAFFVDIFSPDRYKEWGVYWTLEKID